MHLLDRPLRRVAASRLVAAATWPHGIDGYLGVVAPTWSLTDVRARVAGLRRQTPDTVTLRLRPNANWTGARAGQHVVLTVEVDGVRRSRCFSIASAEGVAELELTCKVGPASVVARHLREHVAVGDVLGLSQAQGDFVLPDGLDTDTPILLVGAGSGITPVLAMLRTLAVRSHRGPVRFVHLARTPVDVLHLDDLAAAASQLPAAEVVVVTESGGGGADRPAVRWVTGRFDPGLLAGRGHWAGVRRGGTGADAPTPLAFVCGPPPLMALMEEGWVGAGGAPSAFRTERFTPAGLPASAPGQPGGTVRFARSGVEVANDGRSILEQAEAAGLAPAHGCRMGICHTCVVPATAGCVQPEGGDVTAADGTPVRICVTAPAGDLTIDL